MNSGIPDHQKVSVPMSEHQKQAFNKKKKKKWGNKIKKSGARYSGSCL